MAATTPYLDLLLIETHDSKLLALGDISTYPAGFSVVAPTVAMIVPGFPEQQIPFNVGAINIYNSNTLKITCEAEGCDLEELPDGVYTIKYAIYPAYKYNVTKNFIRIEKLLRKFDEKFLSLELFNCDGQSRKLMKQKVDEVENYMQGAVSAANRCANKLAIELYNKADALLNGIQQSCC